MTSGTDKPAKARAVGPKNDRHVAGEIDARRWRRRCRECWRDAGPLRRHPRAPSAASGRSGARPCGRCCSAPHTRPRTAIVDVVCREKIRRAMRAVENADLHRASSSGRALGTPSMTAETALGRRCAAHRRFEGARRVAAEAAQREGRARAKIERRVEATADGEIGAHSGPVDSRRASAVWPARDVGTAEPVRNGAAIERRRHHRAPVSAITLSLIEPQASARAGCISSAAAPS